MRKIKVVVIMLSFIVALIIGGRTDYEVHQAEQNLQTVNAVCEVVDGEQTVTLDGDRYAFEDDTIKDGELVSVTVNTHGTDNKTAWTLEKVSK